LSGTLKVSLAAGRIRNAYSINPRPRCHVYEVVCRDATLGKPQRTFSVVGTSILCVYTCTASGYHGAEHMGQLDAPLQRGGILLLNERRLSSWQLLTRKPVGD